MGDASPPTSEKKQQIHGLIEAESKEATKPKGKKPKGKKPKATRTPKAFPRGLVNSFRTALASVPSQAAALTILNARIADPADLTTEVGRHLAASFKAKLVSQGSSKRYRRKA